MPAIPVHHTTGHHLSRTAEAAIDRTQAKPGHAGGWPVVRLGEVLHKSGDWIELDPLENYTEVSVRLWGRGVVARGQRMGSEIAGSRRLRVRPRQFILSRIDARNGAFGLVPSELDGAVVSNDFPTFNTIGERLLPEYLGWLCRTRIFIEQCRAVSEGTTNRVRLNEKRFLRIEIPLPPLAEQRRVVAKIEHLAVKINEAYGLRERTNAETHLLVGSAVGQVFGEWGDATWSGRSLGDFVQDDCYGTSEKTQDEPLGVPVLRMGNIQNGRIATADLKYLPIAERDREKWILRTGDILVNRTNSAELVGKCAVFDLEGEWGFASYLIRLRLDHTRAMPRLVAACINSPSGRSYMFRERKQMTGQANVNAKTLKALPLSLPPLEEQRRIVTYLDSLQAKVDRLKALQQKTATELDALLPSILDKAFKGEL